MPSDATAMVQSCLWAVLIIAVVSIISLVQVLKWILLGRGLLERRDSEERGRL